MDVPIMTNSKFYAKYGSDILDPETGDVYGTMTVLPIAGAPGITHDCLYANVYTQPDKKFLLAISSHNTGDIYKVVRDFSNREGAFFYAYDWAKANLGSGFFILYAEVQ